MKVNENIDKTSYQAIYSQSVAEKSLPPTTMLVIFSTSDPVIKPRQDRPQYVKKLDNRDTKG